MQYNQPYGVSDPNAPYINGNPTTGTMGSIPPAASIEFPQREIVDVISECRASRPSTVICFNCARRTEQRVELRGR